MAVYAAVSGLLRDTALHSTRRLAPESAQELTVEHPLWWILVYWGMFAALILLSCYLAVVDIRYIRLQYALEKRRIFRRTVGDAEFRDSLLQKEKGKKREDSKEHSRRDTP